MTADSTPDYIEAVRAELAGDGARRFAGWDSAVFDAVAAGPARRLAAGANPQTVRGYLRMVQEAVGLGLVRRAAEGPLGWTGFLERALIDVIPRVLPSVPTPAALPTLVAVWNLGEGLRREPGWLDRYVAACAGGLTDLAGIEEFLVRTLEPVLEPPPASTWAGPFRVTVLDFRPLHDEFLPGEIRVAAPTVLCVEDRRLSGVQAGVLLRPGGKTQLLGLTNGLGEYHEGAELPSLEFRDGGVSVGGKPAELPFLRRCHRHAAVRAGFLAASAVDSQRLWVLESA